MGDTSLPVDQRDFKSAHAEFLDELAHEEKKQFTKIDTYESFLTELQKFQQFPKKHKKWTGLCNAVQKCSEQLQPYFEVVGIAVQSHPEWAALAWGSLRLVLLLASNYGMFFDKLGGLFDELSKRIPAYNELSQILHNAQAEPSLSQRFRDSLRKFYLDLFELFKAVARVFTKKDTGRLKKTRAVVANVLWKPFDVRFANVLQRLDKHRDMLELEIEIAQVKLTSLVLKNQASEAERDERFEKMLEQHTAIASQQLVSYNLGQKGIFVDQFKSWLNAPPFAGTYERLRDLRIQGTAEWIFDMKEYVDWLDLEHEGRSDVSMPNFIWVRGNPGFGKSVLAASVIRKLIETSTTYDAESPLVTFFFFEHNARNGLPIPRDHAYRAILAQLLHRLHQDEKVIEIFSFSVMNELRLGDETATNNELVELMQALAACATYQWYIIVDGIDECAEADDFLIELSSALDTCTPKVLLLSRPNVRFLRQNLQPSQILTACRLHNQDGLRICFDVNIRRLQDSEIIPSAASLEKLVSHLLVGADGMFQWARLMLAHLQSDGLSPYERLDVIENLDHPEELDDMYQRIVALMSKNMASEQVLARRIILWIAFGKRHLTDSEMEEILSLPGRKLTNAQTRMHGLLQKNIPGDFEHRVIMVTGSLVEARLNAYTKTTNYTFIHSSAHEYFTTRCESPDALCGSTPGTMEYFLPASVEVHAELAAACLAYITRKLPSQPLSGNMFRSTSKLTTKERMPFVDYAVNMWPFHLQSMASAGDSLESTSQQRCRTITNMISTELEGFLKDKIKPMVWVEGLYTFESHDSHESLHSALSEWAAWASGLESTIWKTRKSQEMIVAIAEFANDLNDLHQQWGDTLRESPHQLWNDVTAFTSSQFFVTTSAVTVSHLQSETPHKHELSSCSLSKISRDDPNTETLAVLTIWPSKAYERHGYKHQDPLAGWFAQYQLWDIDLDDPVVIEDIFVSLDKDAVRIQHDRFRRLTTHGRARSAGKRTAATSLHFPTSIDVSLQTFTVLTTVFRRHSTTVPIDSARGRSAVADIWRPIALPIQHTEVETLLSGLPTPTTPDVDSNAENSTTSIICCQNDLTLETTQAYRVTTSGDYALYQSIEEDDETSDGMEKSTSIAVYQLDFSDDANPSRLLACIEGNGTLGAIYHCVFHPTLPLLAFHFDSRFVTIESRIVLWRFTPDSSSYVIALNHFFSSRSLDARLYVSYIASLPTLSNLAYLQFSVCGTNLVYQPRGYPMPFTAPLQDFRVYQLALEQQREKMKPHVQKPDTQNLELHSNGTMIANTALPNHMALNVPVVAPGGLPTRLAYDSTSANRVVSLMFANKNSAPQQQPLLSLPAWDDVKHISISLRMPTERRQEKITVVLNKTAQPSYVFGSASKQTAPAVVRKDVRVLQDARGLLIEDAGKRHGNEDDGNSRAAKRRRIVAERRPS
ncbi:hypothetical protein IQ07DRAFT_598053 [Pyrenochaeta sp. DS3sAY3a]|nr:hypothetical protein IQ07DRAFT_598053 [Pyrenochaeta sp. DS3sAY3a]